MIDAAALLADARRLVGALEGDIRERAAATAEVDEGLRREHQRALAAGRTGAAFEAWRDERVTQAAVAWVLAGVFVRFCEDNHLVGDARLAGPDERLGHARDRQTLYFRAHPEHSDREYLLSVYDDVAGLPGMGALFDPTHNPLWQLPVSADGATRILELFRRQDPATGKLIHNFFDPTWDTRFLGDLYQDLSEDARKRYALLQTPRFVEEFILEHTLKPAIDAFGLERTTLIDPACGSGHFLLGAFVRLLDRWLTQEPATPERVLIQRVLDAIAGVDLNPFAVAIARFRLSLAALRAGGITRLADAPGYRLHLVIGDSLLHGRAPAPPSLHGAAIARPEAPHVYRTEDAAALEEIFGRHYAVVVGNPPYVSVKDRALNQAYRARFSSCHRQYSLAVPFTERFFDLAYHQGNGEPAGFVGMITANTFMKREFGKKLIEEHLPYWDLTHVIDTSQAFIPGHNATTIIFARARSPHSPKIRTVMGVRGERTRPAHPRRGPVWTAVVKQIDEPGSESDYVSVADTPRTQFKAHPWSIGGGGAAELKDELDAVGEGNLDDVIMDIGSSTVSRLDDVYVVPIGTVRRWSAHLPVAPFADGEDIRDWSWSPASECLWPYDESIQARSDHRLSKVLWPWRSALSKRVAYGKTQLDRGLRWTEFSMVFPTRIQGSAIAFADLTTANHFARRTNTGAGNRHAPVIKLPAEAGEDDLVGLLGLLNSSTACFWMQQVCQNKGRPGIHSAGADEGWEFRFEFDARKLRRFPIIARRPLEVARRLDRLAGDLRGCEPSAVCDQGVPSRTRLLDARRRWEAIRAEMIASQEELDWEVLYRYDLASGDLVAPSDVVPPLRLGERAFEIVLARRLALGEVETTWFSRHRSTPVTEIPPHWPTEYQRVVEARIEAIIGDRNIGLIERPECKRRWTVEQWEDRQRQALRTWLLNRLEGEKVWGTEPRLYSVATLTDAMRADADFVSVAGLYAGRTEVDLTKLAGELVASEAVPFLAAARYSDTGMGKRAVWERIWELQRGEDRGEDVGPIPAPPKYAQGDFVRTSYGRLRGELDVPKERFISYPFAGRDQDLTLVVGWAGWDHLQQALALAAWLVDRRTTDNWDAARLKPLLGGLAELIPWVKQWHNDPDPNIGQGMGDYLAGFLDQTLLELALTRADLAVWRPPAQTRGRRKAAPSP